MAEHLIYCPYKLGTVCPPECVNHSLFEQDAALRPLSDPDHDMAELLSELGIDRETYAQSVRAAVDATSRARPEQCIFAAAPHSP